MSLRSKFLEIRKLAGDVSGKRRHVATRMMRRIAPAQVMMERMTAGPDQLPDDRFSSGIDYCLAGFAPPACRGDWI